MEQNSVYILWILRDTISQGRGTCHIINTRQYKCNYKISETVVMQQYYTYYNGNMWQNNVALFKNISVNVCPA